jgi:hypothetical protein
MSILLGVFIGIIIGVVGIISIRMILRNIEIKNFLEEEKEYEFLVNLLIDNNIIKDGTKYLINIEEKCVYVLMNNKLNQYNYIKNKNEFLEVNSINLSENIAEFIKKYSVGEIYSPNLLYSNSYRIIRQKKYKI